MNSNQGTVYLNGEYMARQDAMISPFDRSFLFADAAYEVIPVRQGRIALLPQHLQRLRNSLGFIGMECPMDDAKMQEVLQKLLRDNGSEYCALYLHIGRGIDFARSPIAEPEKPTVFAACLQMNPQQLHQQRQGVKLALHKDIRWDWCHIKVTALTPNMLMRKEAAKSGCHEMLMHRDGNLTEGSASNVMVVQANGEIHTPPLDANILPGITRQAMLDVLKQHKLPHQECAVPVASLDTAKEVWLCSSVAGLVPVLEVAGKTVADGKPGELWHKADALLLQAELASAA